MKCIWTEREGLCTADVLAKSYLSTRLLWGVWKNSTVKLVPDDQISIKFVWSNTFKFHQICLIKLFSCDICLKFVWSNKFDPSGTTFRHFRSVSTQLCKTRGGKGFTECTQGMYHLSVIWQYNYGQAILIADILKCQKYSEKTKLSPHLVCSITFTIITML